MQMISFLYLTFFSLILHPLEIASTPEPGCPARCGNVTIPYPFGVGSRCSLGPSFNITCNTTTTPPKPYLNIINKTIEVFDISLGDPAQIRIRYPYLIYGTCYNVSSGDSSIIDLSGTQYTLSENNWLTTIGCNDFGATSTAVGDNYSHDACIGFCSDTSSYVGVCPNNGNINFVGRGCCRVPIPKGARYLDAEITDLSAVTNRTRLFPCSYAFLKEKGITNKPSHTYNLSILQQTTAAFFEKDQRLQVVRLDWRIGNQNCSRASVNSTYACQANADCVDFGAEIEGYLCNCSQGYVGNPYL